MRCSSSPEVIGVVAGRRRLLGRVARTGLALSGAVAGLTGKSSFADTVAPPEIEKLITRFTGGRVAEPDGFVLTLPSIAENGASVPVLVDIESPMSAEDHVVSVRLFAPDNPYPEVLTLGFTPASGVARASARMRLAQTQTVYAVALLSDGRALRAEAPVKVTIGGCGG